MLCLSNAERGSSSDFNKISDSVIVYQIIIVNIDHSVSGI